MQNSACILFLETLFFNKKKLFLKSDLFKEKLYKAKFFLDKKDQRHDKTYPVKARFDWGHSWHHINTLNGIRIKTSLFHIRLSALFILYSSTLTPTWTDAKTFFFRRLTADYLSLFVASMNCAIFPSFPTHDVQFNKSPL